MVQQQIVYGRSEPRQELLAPQACERDILCCISDRGYPFSGSSAAVARAEAGADCASTGSVLETPLIVFTGEAVTVSAMRCGSKTVYLAPGEKVSLATHQLVAVVDGERRRLWSRSAVKALLADPSGWDGSCEVVAADGTTRRVRLDARIVDGHLPDNARWWRISQLDQARGGGGSSAALLEQVGGARQLAELLFAEPNRRAGRVAAEAVCAGRGGHVSAVACAAGLISADDAANILEQCAEVPWAKWFTPFDPDGDGGVIAATLAMTAPEHRVRILTGWLTSLPAGLTPELVADLAGDDAFAEALCGQGSLSLVAALLSVRGELPKGAARALRGQDLVT